MFLQDLCGDLVAVNDIQYIEDLQAKDDYQITFILLQFLCTPEPYNFNKI